MGNEPNTDSEYFVCDQCGYVYTKTAFQAASILYGLVMLRSHDSGYYGITCLNCKKTTIQKSDLASLRTIEKDIFHYYSILFKKGFELFPNMNNSDYAVLTTDIYPDPSINTIFLGPFRHNQLHNSVRTHFYSVGNLNTFNPASGGRRVVYNGDEDPNDMIFDNIAESICEKFAIDMNDILINYIPTYNIEVGEIFVYFLCYRLRYLKELTSLDNTSQILPRLYLMTSNRESIDNVLDHCQHDLIDKYGLTKEFKPIEYVLAERDRQERRLLFLDSLIDTITEETQSLYNIESIIIESGNKNFEGYEFVKIVRKSKEIEILKDMLEKFEGGMYSKNFHNVLDSNVIEYCKDYVELLSSNCHTDIDIIKLKKKYIYKIYNECNFKNILIEQAEVESDQADDGRPRWSFYKRNETWWVGMLGKEEPIIGYDGMAIIHFLLKNPNKFISAIQVFHAGTPIRNILDKDGNKIGDDVKTLSKKNYENDDDQKNDDYLREITIENLDYDDTKNYDYKHDKSSKDILNEEIKSLKDRIKNNIDYDSIEDDTKELKHLNKILRQFNKKRPQLEKARTNTIKNVQRAKDKIRNAGLDCIYEHLESYMKVATMCSYYPDPDKIIHWILEEPNEK